MSCSAALPPPPPPHTHTHTPVLTVRGNCNNESQTLRVARHRVYYPGSSRGKGGGVGGGGREVGGGSASGCYWLTDCPSELWTVLLIVVSTLTSATVLVQTDLATVSVQKDHRHCTDPNRPPPLYRSKQTTATV